MSDDEAPLSEVSRRELLRQIALVGAGLAACARGERPAARDAASASGHAAPPTAPAPPAFREGDHALLPPQRALLAAAIARILPTDHEPGAAEANVIEYVDRELARPEMSTLKGHVLAGLTALGRASARAAKATFESLKPAEQDSILGELQRSGQRGRDFVFFLTILTIEGFLGDPRWSGNQGGVGWKLIGYGPGSIDGETPAHGHH
jgi:gluconate 2-dehydrogenase gamma chain